MMRGMIVALIFGATLSGAENATRESKVDVAATPQHMVTPAAGAESPASPRFARARVVVKGRIDESRFAELDVDVAERRANGQLVLSVPADRLDALRSLPGNFTARVSIPVRAF